MLRFVAVPDCVLLETDHQQLQLNCQNIAAEQLLPGQTVSGRYGPSEQAVSDHPSQYKLHLPDRSPPAKLDRTPCWDVTLRPSVSVSRKTVTALSFTVHRDFNLPPAWLSEIMVGADILAILFLTTSLIVRNHFYAVLRIIAGLSCENFV
jgi:hypothetical protein